jgi:tetratricopeptide (TPR) repeat protein
MDAYTLYLKDRAYRHKGTLDSFKKTIDYCNQAIEKDPNYAQAYAEIARSYSIIGVTDLLPSNDAFLRAQESAEKAIQLDPFVPESHLALGLVLALGKWDFRGGEIEIRRALELSPRTVDAHLQLAQLLHIIRRFDEYALECKRALELDPLSASTCTLAGQYLGLARRVDESIEALRNAIELDPNSTLAHDCLGYIYVMKGMIEDGISEIKIAIGISGGNDVMQKNDLAYAYAKAGNLDQVRSILADLLRMRERFRLRNSNRRSLRGTR